MRFPYCGIVVRRTEHLDETCRGRDRRFRVVDRRAQQCGGLEFFRILERKTQRAVTTHRQTANQTTIATSQRAEALLHLRDQIRDEGGFHLFLEIDKPGGAGIRHDDDGGRNVAGSNQGIGSRLNAALDHPVIAMTVIAVQQVQHRVAQLRGFVAGRQIDVVIPAAAQRR